MEFSSRVSTHLSDPPRSYDPVASATPELTAETPETPETPDAPDLVPDARDLIDVDTATSGRPGVGVDRIRRFMDRGVEIQRAKAELAWTKAELGQTRVELGQTRAELMEARVELGQTNAELDEAVAHVVEAFHSSRRESRLSSPGSRQRTTRSTAPPGSRRRGNSAPGSGRSQPTSWIAPPGATSCTPIAATAHSSPRSMPPVRRRGGRAARRRGPACARTGMPSDDLRSVRAPEHPNCTLARGASC